MSPELTFQQGKENREQAHERSQSERANHKELKENKKGERKKKKEWAQCDLPKFSY